MKQISKFYYVLIGLLLLCITSCSNDDQDDIKKDIPLAIQQDFKKRYPSGSILSFNNYESGTCDVKFLDEDKNEGECVYLNEVWKMSHVRIKDINRLPSKVQNTFNNTQYRGTELIDVYKTDRAGIERSLYTLHFLYPWHKIKDMTHNVLINDDGFYLDAITSSLNNPLWWSSLSADQFDFIAKKYKGSEVRGYVNNTGSHEYFVLHEGILKYVFFREVDVSLRGFWDQTKYELDIETKIPENVINCLKYEYPDFNYTNIYYVEAPDGDSYWFIDKDDPSEKGYIVPINIGLAR